ncbi:peptidoglycan DD-metalloendopeptidase family protein [Streptomyces chumphonensis]|uniref:peptidoglycan DD-metalloendopeptidase family protein n=1 Tax=Streptomyces chumphonensis TaxID=1214925 RepID=UPI003D72C9A2
MRADRPHPRRIALPSCLAAAALAAVLAGGPATATPHRPPAAHHPAAGDPAGTRPLRSTEAAVAEAARVSRTAGRVTRQYERAKAAAARQRKAVDRLSDRLDRKRAEYDVLRRAVGAAAASQYRSGTFLPGAQVVVADSPEEFLATSGYLARTNRAVVRLARSAKEARAELAREKEQADRALERLQAEEARRHRLKHRVDAALERAQQRATRLRARAEQRRRAPDPERPAAPAAHSAWMAPVASYVLTAGYAARGALWSSGHTGQDFAVRSGTPVRAVGGGTVVRAGYGGPYGNEVVLAHGNGYWTHYAHLSVIQVGVGQRVQAGRQIALSGSTGNSSGPHLHFEVRRSPAQGSSVSPVPWLRARGVVV